jgi:outer membrane receptor protein involved in Fe transport
VLKGPQGTLFGRNTTGGAVLLVPQKPTGDLDGYVEASYGNYDPLERHLRSRLDVSLFATNVTGDKYFTYVPGLSTAGFGFETYELGQPRMYGVRLR